MADVTVGRPTCAARSFEGGRGDDLGYAGGELGGGSTIVESARDRPPTCPPIARVGWQAPESGLRHERRAGLRVGAGPITSSTTRFGHLPASMSNQDQVWFPPSTQTTLVWHLCRRGRPHAYLPPLTGDQRCGCRGRCQPRPPLERPTRTGLTIRCQRRRRRHGAGQGASSVATAEDTVAPQR